jgi:hypothetical protein
MRARARARACVCVNLREKENISCRTLVPLMLTAAAARAEIGASSNSADEVKPGQSPSLNGGTPRHSGHPPTAGSVSSNAVTHGRSSSSFVMGGMGGVPLCRRWQVGVRARVCVCVCVWWGGGGACVLARVCVCVCVCVCVREGRCSKKSRFTLKSKGYKLQITTQKKPIRK